MNTYLLFVLFLALGVAIGTVIQRLSSPLVGVMEVSEENEKKKFNMIWMMPVDEVTTNKYVLLKITHK